MAWKSSCGEEKLNEEPGAGIYKVQYVVLLPEPSANNKRSDASPLSPSGLRLFQCGSA